VRRGGNTTARSARERPEERQKRQAFHVRLGTFRSRDEANRVRKRLRTGGYPTVVQQVKIRRQQRYLVTIVGLSSRATAQKVAQTLKRAYRLDTQVVAADA
jgi:cell division septation protein DedD